MGRNTTITPTSVFDFKSAMARKFNIHQFKLVTVKGGMSAICKKVGVRQDLCSILVKSGHILSEGTGGGTSYKLGHAFKDIDFRSVLVAIEKYGHKNSRQKLKAKKEAPASVVTVKPTCSVADMHREIVRCYDRIDYLKGRLGL